MYFTKISKTALRSIQDCPMMPLCYASKQASNWMLSSTSEMGLLGLMQPTMLHNIKIYCYLQSLPGIVGEEASRLDYSLWQVALTFLNRHACCLDAGIAQNNGSNCLLCQMGQKCQSISPAHDQAQIAVLEIVYPQSQIFLCTWHMLHTIQSHFITTQFVKLWEKIKAWVITEDLAGFFNIWDEISTDPSVPQSVVEYLASEWLQVLDMWSKVARRNRSIFEEGNTNMLIECYDPP
jgi:hypothetical protein